MIDGNLPIFLDQAIPGSIQNDGYESDCFVFEMAFAFQRLGVFVFA
jgi:hypothetical protein